MKIALIQNLLAPYRLPLFEQLGSITGVGLEVFLLSKRAKSRPRWRDLPRTATFPVRFPFGGSVLVGTEREICINPGLAAALWRYRPEVVIAGGYGISSLIANAYCRASRAAFIIWSESTRHTDGHVQGLTLRMRRWLATSAHATIDAGSLAREYLRDLRPAASPGSYFRAYNSVDGPLYQAHRDATQAPQTPPRLIFVGNLNARKGIPELLAAYRELSSLHPEPCELHLVGDGELRPLVEEFRQRENLPLLLHGWKDPAQVAEIYARCSALVLLSRIDHNPLVVVEALQAGLPVVASPGVCNGPDFILDGVNGAIVDPADARAVATRVSDILTWDRARRVQAQECSTHLLRDVTYAAAAAAFHDAAVFATQQLLRLAAKQPA